MAPPAAAAPAVVEEREQQPAQGIGQMFTGIIRIAVIYYFASKFFSSGKQPLSGSGSGPAVQISNLFQKSEYIVCFFFFLKK